jgi:hypothetical protein
MKWNRLNLFSKRIIAMERIGERDDTVAGIEQMTGDVTS